MKWKKIIRGITCGLLMPAILIGCTSKPNTYAGSSGSSEISQYIKKKTLIGFSQLGSESGWRAAETSSIKDIPTQDSNVILKFADGQQKQEKQIQDIKSFIAQKVNVIAIDPVVETGWDEILQEAKDANIPVIIVDRQIKVSDESLYKCFLGSDFEEEGQRAAKVLIDKFGKDATLNIAELQGSLNSSAQVGRKKGFDEVIKDCPNYKIIKSQTGDFERAKGKEVMADFLKSDGNTINVLWSHNDDMAVGAIQAIEEYGKKPGKDIFILSVDGIKDFFQAMADGKANATVECNPLLGPQLLETSKAVIASKSVDKWVKSKEGVFLQDQASKELPNRQY
jgi:ABC-type sugar transport system substrate-binding protein